MRTRLGRTGGHRPGLERLEDRRLLTAPVLDPLSALTVPASKSRIVPLTATDADGNPLTYSVTSSGSAINARVVDSGVDLKLSVAGFGDLIFELLPDFAPNTVSQIETLVNKGFYNGLTFHRVVPNFVIQGGDPAGNGSGGPGFTFNDEFNPEAIFSGDGQLAMANSGKDTNGSQFFVTLGTQRFLDFNHTIFGQLVRGFDVMRAIDAVPTDSNSKPTTPVVITSASIINDTNDAVLVLDAAASGSATVTVTVSDGHGGTDTKSFNASAAVDGTDDPPILGPVSNQTTLTNTSIDIPLTGTDLENNPMTFAAAVLDSPAHATFKVTGNVVTVTPEAGYKGVINLLVGVKQTNATGRGSTSDPYDKQAITITVKDQAIQPTGANVSGTRGVAVSGTVATFTAAVPQAASKFTATINWGDNSSSAGTIVAQANGSYTVTGTHTYATAQTFNISTVITDSVTSASGSVGSTATIIDPSITATFLGLTPAAGTSTVSGDVASFKDTNTASTAADFTGAIDWGDGTTTVGTVSKASDGSLRISGSKTYASAGPYAVKVSLSRQGAVVSRATGTLTIPNRAPTLDPIADQSVNEGSTLIVAAVGHDADSAQTLTYALAAGPAGATINASTGVISWTPAQGPTSALFTVTATDSGTPALAASRSFAVDVKAVVPSIILAPSAGITQFSAFQGSGSFSDAGTGPWTATVDYGDGSGRVAMPFSADRTFVLNHVYTSSGMFSVNVQVSDPSGMTGSTSMMVPVAEAPTVQITSASYHKVKKAVTGFDVTAGGALDPSSVAVLSNYVIVSAGKDKKFGTRDDIVTRFKTATYDASKSMISLTFAKKFTPQGTPQLQVNGLRDRFGRPVSFTAAIGKAKLTILSRSR